jgi:ATP-dependent RNA helicase DDX3X
MACAQTGSGKTAAFLFPIISRLIQFRKENFEEVSKNQTDNSLAYPFALVLAPTRELAMQIHNVAKKFCYRSHLKSVVVYGGANFNKQTMEMSHGCHILVATPGRLIDMIERKKISLQFIKYLCFDEADRMLDMGFEDQMRKIVFNLGMPDKYHRQTSMFSATFPDSIRQMAKDFLNTYAFIAIGRIGSTTELVTQYIKFVEDGDKKQELVKLIKNMDGRTLIFAATKKTTDHLGYYLCQMGFSATSIHGDRSQTDRENALRDFKSDRVRVLVATDVAARGLHIENVVHVINFDLPSNVEDYVHRIGRTGRCGKLGTATSFFNSSNLNIVKDLIHLLKDNKQNCPDWLLDFGREAYSNKRGKNNNNRMKKRVPYQKDWRQPKNSYGNNLTYTGQKVYNYSHTPNTFQPPQQTYWKTDIPFK